MSKILLIEDMPHVRRAISTLLRKEGHEVVEASDGQDGLRQFSEDRFDLVITDILMPDTDGTEVVLALKRQASPPPVIAMSGGGGGVPANAALTLAQETADIALTKPFENGELLDAIQRLS